MNENSCVCRKVWTHDTGVLLLRQTKGQSKEIKMRSLLAWRYIAGLASIYRPIYCGRKGEEGGPEYFIIRRGGLSYSLSLGFRILRIHICQLSSEEVQRKRTKGIWALWSKACWTKPSIKDICSTYFHHHSHFAHTSRKEYRFFFFLPHFNKWL